MKHFKGLERQREQFGTGEKCWSTGNPHPTISCCYKTSGPSGWENEIYTEPDQNWYTMKI